MSPVEIAPVEVGKCYGPGGDGPGGEDLIFGGDWKSIGIPFTMTLDFFGTVHGHQQHLIMKRLTTTIAILILSFSQWVSAQESSLDQEFERLGDQYIDQFAAFSPIRSTTLGDHRFDDQLDQITEQARSKRLAWLHRLAERLDKLDANQLSRQNQVDYALLRQELEAESWKLTELREWEWNPLIYTRLAGDSIYGLMARDFAPVERRLENATKRLEQLPRFLKQVRATLKAERVPTVHAKTATLQNRGFISTLNHLIRPRLNELTAAQRAPLTNAIQMAEAAISEHQQWLESELLPNAKGDYRLGIELYEKKLGFSLHSPLRREEIRVLADKRVRELHAQMYSIAKGIYREQYPLTTFPDSPSEAYQRAVIRFGLEKAYAEAPQAGEIVATAQRSVASATEFIRESDLITVMPDPLEIIVMPEFQRGVSLAYCDAPGPLETDQQTFYAVSPIPANWNAKQIRSHLREYNRRSVDVLTIHEAMPGHFLQLAHANRFAGKLRHLLQSGTFVEGWAVYAEWMMCEEGFQDGDPLLKLITLKWYLRDVTNAILDHAVHVDGIGRHEAMRLMMEDAFQEEREAAGKWTRAQLTSGQLSTYFVGYLEHVAMRRDVENAWGDDFDLKTYHDKVLSFGSPPPQFVRALILDEAIPLSSTRREIR